MHVPDAGCGIGASACHLAMERGCHVTGINLTRGDIEVATALAERTGLANRGGFDHSSVTELPCEPDSFRLDRARAGERCRHGRLLRGDRADAETG
jgi:2-polyprenyl-3-methyl-5-hydroxy-6-metoxy-1,4-benzoquinol methylase